ncbi:hypothetical protein H2200_004376 [Cladophialophora chaetospira]|uniref:FAD-binding domain-containing protein n=1 Tax=Cladophialophora chaetospira TaxID=386627 RepID=A0AA39CK48_9EURO|nr:hypothetical protein H2200_004376 [Cladophialophora chaetospira]
MVDEHTTPVLVVGAGPAGLITALQLAENGTKCMLVERNNDTTQWPKMDITNCRSMELLKRLKVDQGLREAIFEAWLKPRIQEEPLIDSHFGMKLETLTETDDGVECELTKDGKTHRVEAQYVIGCDGAGSRVRKAIGIELVGGPVPAKLHLVHFKSRDLSRLHRQGQFWHIFFTSGHVIISQDEVDTWTAHTPLPLDFDTSIIDPYDAVYRCLGGSREPFKIDIEKILVTSSWRPNICIAEKYISPKGRVFLSGDAAHQNIPTGAYGMNTAVGDSFDIGWKVAAVLAGYGGASLLQSYETERKPVAARNLERSGVHWSQHLKYWDLVKNTGDAVTSQTPEGDEVRKQMHEHLQENDGENKDHGVELGYRYNGSPVIVTDQDGTREPEWNNKNYIPSTWPGARAPHVFLKDGETSIFDLFGKSREYSLVDFTPRGKYIEAFGPACKKLGIPLKAVHLPDDPHVRKVWERDAVLVRPDDHVAWRTSQDAEEPEKLDIPRILSIVTGKSQVEGVNGTRDAATKVKENGFTGTVGNVDQSKVEHLAAFQR